MFVEINQVVKCIKRLFDESRLEVDSSTYQSKQITLQTQSVPWWKTVVLYGRQEKLQHVGRVLYSVETNLAWI